MQLAIPTFSCSIGLRPATALSILAAAGFCCCVPMAMPQGHLVALCTDVGISASVGAAMLSMLHGLAFLSRQFWASWPTVSGGSHDLGRFRLSDGCHVRFPCDPKRGRTLHGRDQ
jgi:hypothetical protein